MSISSADVVAGSSALVGGMIRPRATARRLAGGCFATPAVAVLVTSLAWSALSLLLLLDGHAPSVTLVPLPPHLYYGAQAALLPALLVLGWLCLSRVAHGRLPGPWRRSARALAAPYAGSILWIFVVPDVVGYLALGFSGLPAVLRFTGPLLLIGAWVLVAVALRAVQEISRARAVGGALAGLLAQAALLAPLVR